MTRLTRWKLLLAAAVVAAALVAGTFAWRTYQGGQSREHIGHGQQTLCQILRKLVSDSGATLESFDYYKHHPADLARARAQNERTLRRLNCAEIAGG